MGIGVAFTFLALLVAVSPLVWIAWWLAAGRGTGRGGHRPATA